MPALAGVVVERGSEYILAHTGPREGMCQLFIIDETMTVSTQIQ